MRIMYVEDNQVNLALVERIARMGGHQIVSFPNGEDALKALETDPCELILMDIELEGQLDGVEVVKILRERGDKRPVIAVTAYAMVGDMERILEAGCNEYLPKPIPIAQFITLLAKYDPANEQPASVADEAKPEAKVEPAKPSISPFAPEPTTEGNSVVDTASKDSPKPIETAAGAPQTLVAEPSATASTLPQSDTTGVETKADDGVAKVTESVPEKGDDTIPSKPEGAKLAVEAAAIEPLAGAKPSVKEEKVAADADLPNGQKEKDNDGR
ncbi:MAG: response regulator [Anaerolineales bacterium]|nr:response regulator [Anaerolineales bacterium]